MKVGITCVPVTTEGLDYAVEAERLGVDSVWVPEWWAYDALTPLAALAMRTERVRLGTAIAQLGARTPAMLAMSSMALQSLSGGRFVLGLGTSGPQVMEGWHGVRFDKPLARTRETVEILRLATSGQRVSHDGEIYPLPVPGSQGRAIRSQAPPVDVPVFLASLGPRNLRLTGEIADGWIGTAFFCETAETFWAPIRAGALATGRTLEQIDLTVAASLEVTDDVMGAGRRHAAGYAFTIGAMGTGSANFYNDAFARQGFGDAVARVQQLWADGDKEAAGAVVPTEIGLRTNLLGPPDKLVRRLRQYAEAGVGTLRVTPVGGTVRAEAGRSRGADGLPAHALTCPPVRSPGPDPPARRSRRRLPGPRPIPLRRPRRPPPTS